LEKDEIGMIGEFSGSLRERVTIERRTESRDAAGGRNGPWLYDGAAWVGVTPLIPASLAAADTLSASPRWQVVMRKREGIGVGTRLVWRGKFLAVRSVISDPRDPARMILTSEEMR
jgi:head-tail adaptor